MAWVFVDMSFLTYRALYSVGNLEYEDLPTGVIFGFFNQLKSICENPKVMSNKVILFFDSRQSYRIKQYPEYKKKRRAEKDENELARMCLMFDQIKVLRTKILPSIGVMCHRQTGLESDDLLAYAASTLKGPQRQGVIITGDQDLFQCISSACHWFDPQRGIYWTRESFEAAKGIDPASWGLVKTIAGCSSDNVAGIPGVGEASAIKFLKDALPKNFKKYQSIVSEKGVEICERNVDLVCLPHFKTKPFKLREPEWNYQAFKQCCKQYGLATFLTTKAVGWKNFFKGVSSQPKTRKRGGFYD